MTEGSTPASQPSPTVANIYKLIKERYTEPTNVQLDKTIFVSSISALDNEPCIWCRHPRIAGELLRLLSFPSNDATLWFRTRTTESLASCAACLQSYYEMRPVLGREFGQIYEGTTLTLFWNKVDEFDTQRLGTPLGRFISGEVDHKSPSVLFALYEILLYPRHLRDPMLHEKFTRVLGTLIEARKMIKVTRILPGLLTCLFDEDEVVWKWASSVLSKDDNTINHTGGDFIEESFDLTATLQRALQRREEDHQRLPLLMKWLPVKIVSDHFNQFASTLLSVMDENASVYASLSILLKRVSPGLQVVTEGFWKSFLASAILSMPLPILEGNHEWIGALGRWCKGTEECQTLLQGLMEALERRSKSVATPRERITLASMLAAFVSLDEVAPLMVMVPLVGSRALKFLFEAIDHCTSGKVAEPIHLIPSLAEAICAVDLAALEVPQEGKIICAALKELLRTASSPLQASLCNQLTSLLLERPRELWKRYGRIRPEMAKSICVHLQSTDCCASGTLELLLVLATSASWSLDARRLGELFKSHPVKFISSYSAVIIDTCAADSHQLAPLISLTREVIQRCLFTGEGTLLDMFPDRLDATQRLVNSVILLCISCVDDGGRGTMMTIPTLDSLVRFLGRLVRIDASIHLNELKKEHLLWMIEKLLEHYLTESKDDGLVDRVTGLLRLATCRRLKLTHGVQKSLGVLFVSLRGMSALARDRLDRAINKYERQTSTALPRPSPPAKTDSAVAPLGAPHTTVVRRPAVVDIDDAFEERILASMQGASERRKERSLPISLRSNLIPLTLPSRTGSKLEQLKAEAVRDAIPAIGPTVRKRPSAHVSLGGAVKLERLDDRISSASESELEEGDFMALRSKFESTATTGNGKVSSAIGGHLTESVVSSSRSVKLIDVTDAASGIIPLRGGARGAREEEDKHSFPGGSLDEPTLIRRFHQRILNFNLQPDAEEALTTDETLLMVPSSFSSPSEYISIFEPLLFTECRAQLLASAEEAATDEIRRLRIVAVTKVDNCHEIQLQGEAGTEGSSSGEDDRSSFRLGEQDYLTVHFDGTIGTEGTARAADQPSLAVRLPAIVIQVIFKGGTAESTLRLIIPADRPALQLELREGKHLRFLRIGNVITNFREYMALHSIRTISLAPLILNPTLPAITDAEIDTNLNGLMTNLHLNRSQARAIQAVLSNYSPMTLIQGPPGTGKTRTIEGLLGTLVGRSRRERKKILICAPSNAAIDEIVRRIRQGLCDAQGHGFPVQIIRVGAIDMISEDIKELTIESQIDRRVQHSMEASSELLSEQRRRCDELRRSLDSIERTGQDEGRMKALKTALWEAREALRKNNKFIEDTRAMVRQKILGEAQIICCTLSSSGHDMLARLDFDTVIIDEACQAVELSSLIPLQRNVRRCVLVGDPNQLPPTVISQMASVYSYEQSLFVRMQRQCPQSVLLLDTQYRMHPEISLFPNQYFYEGRLVDGPDMAMINARDWHSHPLLGPFRFFDIHGGREESRARKSGLESRSKLNELEARIAANLVALLCQQTRHSMVGKIGLVTPYKDQRRALRRELVSRFGTSVLASLEVSTVDGFQGQEREVIIFSCVRTSEPGTGRGLGFLNDTRRLNVALTRAKCSLLVLGRAASLVRNPIWRALIEDARSRGCLIDEEPTMWEGVQRIRTLPKLLQAPSNGKGQGNNAAGSAKGPPHPRIPSTIKTPAQRMMEAQRTVPFPLPLKPQTGPSPRHPDATKPLSSSSSATLTKTASFIDEMLDRTRRPRN